jgi:hypothetical protein
MRSRSEREIARRLAEHGEVEPPADLLGRLKAEIPLEIQAARGLAPPGTDAQPARAGRFRARQAWLAAASLLAMIGTGLFSLHLFEGKRGAAVLGAAVEQSARPLAPASPPTALAAPAGPPPLRLPERSAESAAPASAAGKLPAVGKPVEPQEPRQDIPGGVAGGAPEISQGSPVGAQAESASPPAPSPAPPQPLAADAAEAAGAAPRAKAMTLKKEMRADLTDLGFIDAAASPRDRVEPRAGASALERARPAAAERRSSAWAAREPTDTPAGLVGGAKVDAVRGSPAAEGAPSPFATSERRRLLLFRRPQGADAEAVEVELNPQVVARYRRVSVAGPVLLYEVELQPAAGAAGAGGVAGGGEPVAALLGGARLRMADLAPSWGQATPGFRLAFLAAKLAELEKLPKGSRPLGDLAELLKDARTLAADLPGDPHAQELLGGAERLSP